MTPLGFKFCARCKRMLSLTNPTTGKSAFGIDKRQRDRLHSYCRECRRDQDHLRDKAGSAQSLTIRVSTEYPSRVSVQEHLREIADQLVGVGESVKIVCPSGKIKEWKDME